MKRPPKSKARRKPAAKSPPAPAGQMVYDSMSSAAAALGITRAELKRHKDQGAPGFRDSRVHLLELMPWLKEREAEAAKAGDTGMDEAEAVDKYLLECRKLRLQCERLAHENEVEHDRWLLKADFEQWAALKAESVKAILRSRLRNDLPPKIEGLRAPEIAAAMEPVIAEIIEALRAAA